MKKFRVSTRRLWMAFCLFTVISTAALAAEPNMLTRDEVGALKKKLVAVLAAMGQPPAGYAKEEERFNLPTETYIIKSSGKFQWVAPSVSIHFSGGGAKNARKSQEQFQEEYQKKIAEAIAKGNYEAMGKLAEEMQKKAGEAQLAEVEGKRDPLDLQIRLNTSQTQTLDSDMILLEKPGVIALITDNRDEKKNRLLVLFDPDVLKDTKTLSRVELKQPKEGVSKKNAVLNATIEIIGPAAVTKAWVKQINTGAVLGQIDSGR
jgi:hypothetical protein